jgi:integrase
LSGQYAGRGLGLRPTGKGQACAGRKIREQIDEAIHVYDKLLLVLSPHSIGSEWVRHEIRRARGAEVRESRPVRPVPDAFVDAVLPYVSRQIAAMIELQRLTGMRPGEVVIMRTMDIITSGAIWEYRPDSHKTEHHGKDRLIFLGPKAQEILKPWLKTDLSAFLFSTREAMAERMVALRAGRKTKVQPSQRDRRKRNPKRVPADKYRVTGYALAIRRACDKVGVPHWAPNRLRHNAATRLRREFGLDVAKAVLGHSSVMPTQVYAEQDMEAAAAAMAKVG